MNNTYHRMLAMLILACGLATACQKGADTASTAENRPIKIEHLQGEDPTREILTEEAAKRLDIQTATVDEAQVDGAKRKAIPYAAIVYDTQGSAWVYLNPEPFTYVRHQISVEKVEGNQAILKDEPPAGTMVVTVGVAELYGAEFEFQEE